MSDGWDGRCSRLALRAASTTGGAFLSPTAPQKLLPKPQTPLPLSLKATADLAAQGQQRIVLLRLSKRNSPSSPLSRPRPLLLDEHLACLAVASRRTVPALGAVTGIYAGATGVAERVFPITATDPENIYRLQLP